MLDIQQLRTNLDAVAEGLAKRGKPIDFAEFKALEAERKTLQTRTQDLQAQRNSLSKQIGMLKGKGEDASAVMAQVGALGDELKASEARLTELLGEFRALVHVHLADDNVIRVRGGNLLHHRREHPARAAPRCPEVHQNGLVLLHKRRKFTAHKFLGHKNTSSLNGNVSF